MSERVCPLCGHETWRWHTWDTATPQERADWIRLHRSNHHLTYAQLQKLFCLTAFGAIEILSNGMDGKPEYEEKPRG